MVSDDDPTMRSEIDATFTEVVENELLVGHQDVEGIPGTTGSVRFHLRLEFHAEPGGKTRLELRQGPFSEPMGEQTGRAGRARSPSWTRCCGARCSQARTR